MPGESFVEIAQGIQQASGVPSLVASYCNQVVGYIPFPTAYPQGGYEVDQAYMPFGYPAPYRPEASLLAPDQSYFVRENLKLRLLNARLGLLARQFDAVQSDVRQAVGDLEKYFDSRSRAGQSALALAREVLNQSRQTELPRIDDTLAALTTAAAGR